MKNLLHDVDYNALNSVDITVLIIIGLSILLAFIRGFISSMMSLVGWISSIVITYLFAPHAQSVASKYIHNEILVTLVSYGALLVCSLIGFAILNSCISALLGFLRGGFVDRALGGLFGLFRGMLIASFAFLCINLTSNLLSGNDIKNPDEDSVPEVVKQAQTYKLLSMGSNMIISFLPDTFGTRISDFTDKVEGNLIDERFVSSMVRKIYPHMSPEELDAVERYAHDLSVHKSEEQVELQTAHSLLDRYKQKKEHHELHGKELPDSDVERLERVLNEKQK